MAKYDKIICNIIIGQSSIAVDTNYNAITIYSDGGTGYLIK